MAKLSESNRATTLESMKGYEKLGTGPAGAMPFENHLISNIQTAKHVSGSFHESMIREARVALASYRELFRRPSELDLSYRNSLLLSIEDLESKLDRLERHFEAKPADSWLKRYFTFNEEIGSYANEAKKEESEIDRIVRGLRTFSKVTLAAAVPALAVNLTASLVIGAAGTIARAAASSMESVWETRREDSKRLEAGGGRWAAALSYGKQLVKGTFSAYEETEHGFK